MQDSENTPTAIADPTEMLLLAIRDGNHVLARAACAQGAHLEANIGEEPIHEQSHCMKRQIVVILK